MRGLRPFPALLLTACAGATRAPDTETPKASYLAPEAGHGLVQSPINILTSEARSGGEQVILHYEESEEKVVNLGHTIEVDLEPGNYVMEEGHKYVLKQFHFHTPSEHLLDGVTYPMEMHMVHVREDAPTQYLVMAALFKQGARNAFIESFIDQVPTMAGQSSPAGHVDVREICEHESGFYQYRARSRRRPTPRPSAGSFPRRSMRPPPTRSGSSTISRETTLATCRSSAIGGSTRTDGSIPYFSSKTPGSEHKLDSVQVRNEPNC
ncbi:MAG: carbonic anhydrase family protein [Myxococcota bacterium]